MLVATVALLVACFVGENSSSRDVQILCAVAGVAAATMLVRLIVRD